MTELPRAGSGLAFTPRPLTLLDRVHDRLPSEVVRFGYFGKTLYSLRGPEATELFFSAPNLDPRGGLVEIFGGLLPERFLGEEDAGRHAFGARRPAFDFSSYLDAVRRSTDEVLDGLGGSGEIDLFDLASELSFRASSRFMLGEAGMSQGFFARWRELFFETNPVGSLGSFQWNLLDPLFWRRQDELFGELEALLGGLVEARGGARPGPEQSFLDGSPTGVSRQRAREQAVGHLYVMFLAAYLNPTLTLGWTLSDVLSHPPHGERVRAEVDAVCAEHPDGPLPRAALDRLELLHRCVMETLRLRVKAANVRKVVREPLVFDGCEIPVGAVACNSPTFAHLSEEHYERPNEYRPERWIGTPELHRSSMSARYMPFGTFAHICASERFSHTWLQLAVAELLRRFELEIIGAVSAAPEDVAPALGDRGGPRVASYRRRRPMH